MTTQMQAEKYNRKFFNNQKEFCKCERKKKSAKE